MIFKQPKKLFSAWIEKRTVAATGPFVRSKILLYEV